jgi:hypothetical protein
VRTESKMVELRVKLGARQVEFLDAACISGQFGTRGEGIREAMSLYESVRAGVLRVAPSASWLGEVRIPVDSEVPREFGPDCEPGWSLDPATQACELDDLAARALTSLLPGSTGTSLRRSIQDRCEFEGSPAKLVRAALLNFEVWLRGDFSGSQPEISLLDLLVEDCGE